MGIIMPYYTILIVIIYVELYVYHFYATTIDRGGRIPVFDQKDPDYPFPLEQFNVVLRTVELYYVSRISIIYYK